MSGPGCPTFNHSHQGNKADEETEAYGEQLREQGLFGLEESQERSYRSLQLPERWLW